MHQPAGDLGDIWSMDKLTHVCKEIALNKYDVFTGRGEQEQEEVGLSVNTSLKNYAPDSPTAVHKDCAGNKRDYCQVGTSEKSSSPESLDETRQSHTGYTDAEMPPVSFSVFILYDL